MPIGGVSITSPTENLLVSNTVFTVTGTSWADGLHTVGQVLFSINGSALAEASTTNGWLNWSAQVPLIAGTNFISVQAKDTNGVILNFITDIDFVTFRVVLSPSITVFVNGGGSVTPQYNQTVLPLAKVVTLTAKAKVGSAFTNWTDGNGNIVTNKPTLKFAVVSNLTLTANFVDVAKPTLTVTAPIATTSTTSNSFMASGKAADNLAVDEVRYKLNDNSWEEAVTTNGWTNWTANSSLTAGTNVLSVYAEDDAGNRSPTNTVRFFYVLNALLTVQTNGKGSISPNYNNSLLRIGQNYTLTATPGVGFAFTNWTDAEEQLITNKPALLFRMASNLVFRANFVDVSKPVLTVTAPLTTTSATNEFYLASGKASDNATVVGVYFQLNGGDWLAANTTNAWTNWSTVLDLTPGTNVLSLYAEDNSGNRTATNTVKFVYATAPATLNGLLAKVTPDGSTPFDVAFGTTTFSQISADTNNLNGVGNYTFTRKSPSTAQIKFTYTAPPSAANPVPTTIDLTFGSAGVARFTNSVAADTGDMEFSAAPNLAMSSVAGKSVLTVGSDGQGAGTYFVSGKYVSLDLLTRATNNGSSFTYGVYSRAVALFRLNDARSTSYIVANYLGTNYGVYYSENYGVSGNLLESTFGVFGFASQRPSGNAPTNFYNRSLQIYSGSDEFTLTFRTNTFGQASLNTNFDNAVGNYAYQRADTNHSQLDLFYAAPPSVSGATNTARFTFFADNLAIFTNSDGTISAAVVNGLTNRVPDGLAGKSFVVTNILGGMLRNFQFANDGTFTMAGTDSASGTYSFSTYSRAVGMVQLIFTNGTFAGDTGWWQLNYQSSRSGDSFLSLFDSSDVLQVSEPGEFQQQ